jgi:hypothetical protein
MICQSVNVPRPRAAAPWLVAAVMALLLGLAAGPAAEAQAFLLGARYATAEPSGAAYEAVYDSTVSMPGVQAEVRWPAVFVRLAASQGSADGVLVGLQPGGGVFPTFEPTEITLTPVHLSAGWHRGFRGGWGIYVGGGLTRVEAEEKSAFFRDSNSADGYHLMAGGRHALGERWEASAELLYWQVSDLFEGGLGEALGDADLDAVELALAVSFRF